VNTPRQSLLPFLKLLGRAHLLSSLGITFRNPFACFDHLENIDILLAQHKNTRDAQNRLGIGKAPMLIPERLVSVSFIVVIYIRN
jgi:hypothetical protein